MSLVLFYILGGAILLSALLVVTLRNIFHSALFLVLTFFLVAGIYLMLDAEFVAAIQVLIYVGAVTILILFAIMLTHKIQSRSVRQVNEQVLPAIIIGALFLALAIFSMTNTFHDPNAPQNGDWEASIKLSELPAGFSRWNWTVHIEDKEGRSYIAAAFLMVTPDFRQPSKPLPVKPRMEKDGYLLSANSDFSTVERVFSSTETAYIKVWTESVNSKDVTKAVWKISAEDGPEIIVNLSHGGIEKIGRLLMSEFVLPFEIVSVLLLAALVGAIVIARKDE